ncbi:MAG: hypothetical protein WDN72_09695 [Alphaproteobacteria bacterium]
MRISFLATSSPVAVQQPGAPPRMANPVYDGINDKGQRSRSPVARPSSRRGRDDHLNMRSQLWRSDSSWVKVNADTADYFQTRASCTSPATSPSSTRAAPPSPPTRRTSTPSRCILSARRAGDGVGPTGSLLATGFEIMDKGDHIRFGDKDRVSVHIDKSGK